jgi:hypothetical protein
MGGRLVSLPPASDAERMNQRAPDEQKALSRVVLSLEHRFPRASSSAVERAVDKRYLEFYGAPIRTYIPLLVERVARDDLRAELASVPAASVSPL